MLNFTIAKEEIIKDIAPNLITSYLLIDQFEIIPKDIKLYIIELVFNTTDEILKLNQDIFLVKCFEILTINVIEIMLNKKINLHLLKYNNQSEIILNTLFASTTQKIEEEFQYISFETMILIDKKIKEYENFIMLGSSKKILIDKLKTDKKYLSSLSK